MISDCRFKLQEGVVVVEPIADMATLEQGASEDDLISVEGFAPARRAERLAWRLLLHKMAPAAEVEYLPSGKPVIKNSKYKYLSVSHCADCVAVMLSQRPCGVDVERVERNYARIAGRYLSVEELSLCDDERWMAMAWCAKEALYKRAGRMGVDFKRDMQIVAVERADDGSSWHLRAVVFGEQTVELHAVNFDAEHVIVYTL